MDLYPLFSPPVGNSNISSNTLSGKKKSGDVAATTVLSFSQFILWADAVLQKELGCDVKKGSASAITVKRTDADGGVQTPFLFTMPPNPFHSTEAGESQKTTAHPTDSSSSFSPFTPPLLPFDRNSFEAVYDVQWARSMCDEILSDGVVLLSLACALAAAKGRGAECEGGADEEDELFRGGYSNDDGSGDALLRSQRRGEREQHKNNRDTNNHNNASLSPSSFSSSSPPVTSSHHRHGIARNIINRTTRTSSSSNHATPSTASSSNQPNAPASKRAGQRCHHHHNHHHNCYKDTHVPLDVAEWALRECKVRIMKRRAAAASSSSPASSPSSSSFQSSSSRGTAEHHHQQHRNGHVGGGAVNILALQALQAEMKRIFSLLASDTHHHHHKTKKDTAATSPSPSTLPPPLTPLSAMVEGLAAKVYGGNLDTISLVLHTLFVYYVCRDRFEQCAVAVEGSDGEGGAVNKKSMASGDGGLLSWYQTLGAAYGLPLHIGAVVASSPPSPPSASNPSLSPSSSSSLPSPPPLSSLGKGGGVPSPTPLYAAASLRRIQRVFGDGTAWLLALHNHLELKRLFGRGGVGGGNAIFAGVPSSAPPPSLPLSSIFLRPTEALEVHHNLLLCVQVMEGLGIHNYFNLPHPQSPPSPSITTARSHHHTVGNNNSDDVNRHRRESQQNRIASFIQHHASPLFFFLQTFLIYNFVSNSNRMLCESIGGRRLINDVIVHRMLMMRREGEGGGREEGEEEDWVGSVSGGGGRDDMSQSCALLHYFNQFIYPPEEGAEAICLMRLPTATRMDSRLLPTLSTMDSPSTLAFPGETPMWLGTSSRPLSSFPRAYVSPPAAATAAKSKAMEVGIAPPSKHLLRSFEGQQQPSEKGIGGDLRPSSAGGIGVRPLETMIPTTPAPTKIPPHTPATPRLPPSHPAVFASVANNNNNAINSIRGIARNVLNADSASNAGDQRDARHRAQHATPPPSTQRSHSDPLCPVGGLLSPPQPVAVAAASAAATTSMLRPRAQVNFVNSSKHDVDGDDDGAEIVSMEEVTADTETGGGGGALPSASASLMGGRQS